MKVADVYGNVHKSNLISILVLTGRRVCRSRYRKARHECQDTSGRSSDDASDGKSDSWSNERFD